MPRVGLNATRQTPPARPALAPPPGVVPDPTIPKLKSFPNPILGPKKGR